MYMAKIIDKFPLTTFISAYAHGSAERPIGKNLLLQLQIAFV